MERANPKTKSESVSMRDFGVDRSFSSATVQAPTVENVVCSKCNIALSIEALDKLPLSEGTRDILPNHKTRCYQNEIVSTWWSCLDFNAAHNFSFKRKN